MYFHVVPLRLNLVARGAVHFPPGKAANTLRGGLGMHLDARLFAPKSQGPGPSGFKDQPRPFVFRVRHLDGKIVPPGERFYVDLNVFSCDERVVSSLIQAFEALAQEGLGLNRGKVDLQNPAGFDRIQPLSIDLSRQISAAPTIQVEFLSPTELKHAHGIAEKPDFPILFSRVRDRISTLRRLYGEGPLDIDFAAAGLRGDAVRMIRCDVQRREAARRSTRTGQTHSIGGFVGIAEYEGDLAEFIPWLEAACWTGVGRQCVWGKGEIAVHSRTPAES